MGVRNQWANAAIVGLVVVSSYAIALWVRVVDPLVVGVGLWSDLFLALPIILLIHLVATIFTDGRTHFSVGDSKRALRVVLANLAATALILLVAVLARTWVVESTPVVPLSVILYGGTLASLTVGMLTFRQRFFSAS